MQNLEKYLLGRKRFNYIRSFFPVYSVQAIINFGTKSKPKILLIERKEEPAKNQWWTPGGCVLKTEDSRRAVMRIVKRETGLHCTIVRQLPTTREIYRNVPGIRDMIADYISENFLLEPINKNAKIRLDKTSSDYRFITKIEAKLHPYVKRHLKNSGLFR